MESTLAVVQKIPKAVKLFRSKPLYEPEDFAVEISDFWVLSLFCVAVIILISFCGTKIFNLVFKT
jgi:hypothetical protein